MKNYKKLGVFPLMLSLTLTGMPLYAQENATATQVDLSARNVLSGSAPESGTKPNIINIILDDYGWADTSVEQLCKSEYYETPNMQRLADQGVTFTHSYSGSNLCSPSRGMIMTGRYGPRNGVARLCNTTTALEEKSTWSYAKNNLTYETEAEPDHLSNDEITIAEQLKQAGYTTCHIGKWHLGNPNNGNGPKDQGFDINIGGCRIGHPPTYFSPYNIPFLENGPAGEYLTDRLGNEAEHFIREQANSDQPFFLNLAHYAVHTKLDAPQQLVQKYIDKYNNMAVKTEHDNPVYAAMIESVDNTIGQVMDTVEELGIADNTIIMVTSDNGGIPYWNVTSNKPLRKGKCFNYEGGIRVPTIMVWKDHIDAGRVESTPIHHTDLFPTYSELAGVPLPTDRKIDGVSLVSLLTQGNKLEKRDLFWYNPHFNRDCTNANTNENPYFYDRGEADDLPVPHAAMLRDNYKLIWNLAPAYYTDLDGYSGVTYELYNLADDEGEAHNLASSEPDRVNTMLRALKQWLYETDAVFPVVVSQKELPEIPGSLPAQSASATSFTAGKEASLAKDDNGSTYWMANIAGPQSITIDLGSEKLINALGYTPVNSLNTGTITQYEIYTSTDNKNYDLVSRGVWANNRSSKKVSFSPVSARYVKLRSIDAAGGKAAAAEVKAYANIDFDNENVTAKKYGGLKGGSEPYRQLDGTADTTSWDGFSVQFNVKLDSLNGEWQTLFEQYSEDMNQFRLDISPEGKVCFHVENSVIAPEDPSRPWVTFESKSTLTPDKWTQIRLSFSNKQKAARLYVDNVLEAESNVKTTLSASPTPFSVGAREESHQLMGQLSNIAVYDGFVEYAEIEENTNALIKGDLNNDKKIDLLDLRMMLRHICKKITLDDAQKEAADLAGNDGEVNLLDLRKLLRFICKKIDTLD